MNRVRILVALVALMASSQSLLAQITACCTAPRAIEAKTSSGGEAVVGQCTAVNTNCYAIDGIAATGDYAGFLYGGKGVYAQSDDPNYSAVEARSYGSNSYALFGESGAYRGGYFKAGTNALYSLYVDSVDGPLQTTAALNVRGTIRGEGNLVIAGSKAGYVVDVMQNVGDAALEPGDVVTIVGSSQPVLGEIPVVTVRKAAGVYDTGVAGVVDQAWYAPDVATKTAYETQELKLRTAMQNRSKLQLQVASMSGARSKPAQAQAATPDFAITEERGTLHALPGVTSMAPGGYVSVVTLGAFKMVKVDATSGAIRPGDLLTTSANPGYAMKVTDKVAAIGAIIGKALGNLDGGTGTIPVLVMQR